MFFLHKKHCLSLAKVKGGEMIMMFWEREGEKANGDPEAERGEAEKERSLAAQPEAWW